MRTVRIDAYAVSDHLGRLYQNKISDDGWDDHIDRPGCRIRIADGGKATWKIEMTDESVVEFLDDMAYQIEFTDQPEYRAQCRRAVRQLRLDS